MNLIYSFYEIIINQNINELNCMKKDGKFFSITIDEWTSKRYRRNLNINVHFEKDFKLRLAPIASSYDAKTMLKLLSEKLKKIHLDLATDSLHQQMMVLLL